MIEVHLPASLGMIAGTLMLCGAGVWIARIVWSLKRSPRHE